MADKLLLCLPDPLPLMREVLAAGAAFQSLFEQQPCLLSIHPNDIFMAPYSPSIASLSPAALLALLRLSTLAGLSAPFLAVLTACLAQRYASLPPSIFEAEVATPCPAWAARVHAWWAERFLALPPEEFQRPCVCSYWAAVPQPSPRLLPVTFGFEPGTAAGPEHWVRGLDCAPQQPPPLCAAHHAHALGQSAWVQHHWHSAQPAGLSALSDLPTILASLEEAVCRQDARVVHLCCLLLWRRLPAWGPTTSSTTAQAVAAVVGALQAYPEDGCIALCCCAFLTGLGLVPLLAAMPTLAQPLSEVLLSPHLPPACTAQAVACMTLLLDAAKAWEAKPQLAAFLAPRLTELLQWGSWPSVQLQACRAVASFAAHEQGYAASEAVFKQCCECLIDSAPLPLVSLLDSPSAALREQAAFTLGCLTRSSWPMRQAIVAAGLLPTLLRGLMPYATTGLARMATWAIARVVQGSCQEQPQYHRLQALLPLLPRLAALLCSEDTAVLSEALSALGSLGSGEEDRQLAVLETGCLARMVALVGHATEEVAVQAMRACKALGEGQWGALSIASQGVLQRAAGMLGQDCSQRVGRSACSLVRRLVNEGLLEAVLRSGCFTGLKLLAIKDGGRLGEEASLTMACACSQGSEAQRQWMVDRGVVETLCCSLAKGQDTCVLIDVLQALEDMLASSQPPGRHKERMAKAGLGMVLGAKMAVVRGRFRRAARAFIRKHFS